VRWVYSGSLGQRVRTLFGLFVVRPIKEILLWPRTVFAYLASSILFLFGVKRDWPYPLVNREEVDEWVLNHRQKLRVLALSPLIYLAILLAANYLLLKPGT